MNNNRKQHLIKTSTNTTYIKFRNKKIRVFFLDKTKNCEFWIFPATYYFDEKLKLPILSNLDFKNGKMSLTAIELKSYVGYFKLFIWRTEML